MLTLNSSIKKSYWKVNVCINLPGRCQAFHITCILTPRPVLLSGQQHAVVHFCKNSKWYTNILYIWIHDCKKTCPVGADSVLRQNMWHATFKLFDTGISLKLQWINTLRRLPFCTHQLKYDLKTGMARSDILACYRARYGWNSSTGCWEFECGIFRCLFSEHPIKCRHY